MDINETESTSSSSWMDDDHPNNNNATPVPEDTAMPYTVERFEHDLTRISNLPLDFIEEQPPESHVSIAFKIAEVRRRVLQGCNPNVWTEALLPLFFFYLTFGHDVAAAVELINASLVFPTEAQDLKQQYLLSRASQLEGLRLGGHDVLLADPPSVIQEDRIDFNNPGRCRLIPEMDEATVDSIIEYLPRQISLLHTHGQLYLKLMNPFPIPCNPVGGILCDLCNRKKVYVSYQAVADETKDAARNEQFKVFEGCQGFDACIGCTVFMVNEAVNMFRRAKLFQGEKISISRSLAPRCAILLHHVAWNYAAGVFDITVGLAPRGTHPIAWVIADHEEDDVNVPIRQLLPAAQWWKHCSITNVNSASATGLGDCPICCESLESGERHVESDTMNVRRQSSTIVGDDNNGGSTTTSLLVETRTNDIVQTNCNHWFHLQCIRQWCNCQESGPRHCPLCRNENFLSTQEDPAEVVQQNVYELKVRPLKPGNREEEDDSVIMWNVYVGSVISPDGRATMVTDIGMLTKLRFPVLKNGTDTALKRERREK